MMRKAETGDGGGRGGDGRAQADNVEVKVPLVHEVYTGRTKVWCGGRCFTGNQHTAVTFSYGATLGTSAIFFASSGEFLWTETSPALVVILAYLLFIVIANLVWSHLTDPGICPRALRDEGDTIIQLPAPTKSGRPPPRERTAMINGREVHMRYCFTCHQYRLPRDTHCGPTDDCVDTFDHFCPWVNNTVGHRNYRYFFWFTFSLIVYIIFVFSLSVYHLVELNRSESTFADALARRPGVLIVIIISFLAFFPISNLVSYHVHIVGLAMTTNENIKARFGGDSSPYDRGSRWKNVIYTLCGPRRAPLMRWREPATLYDLMVWKERTGDADRYVAVINALSRSAPLANYRRVPAQPSQRGSAVERDGGATSASQNTSGVGTGGLSPGGFTRNRNGGSSLSLMNQASSSYANRLDGVGVNDADSTGGGSPSRGSAGGGGGDHGHDHPDAVTVTIESTMHHVDQDTLLPNRNGHHERDDEDDEDDHDDAAAGGGGDLDVAHGHNGRGESGGRSSTDTDTRSAFPGSRAAAPPATTTAVSVGEGHTGAQAESLQQEQEKEQGQGQARHSGTGRMTVAGSVVQSAVV